MAMQRREFMKRSAGIAAGVIGFPAIVSSAALGGGVPAASERVALGHIGVGVRGTSLLRSFLGVDDSQCVAVCDPFVERQEKAAERIREKYAERITSGQYRGCRC